MNLHTTKSQAISLMSAELSAIQKQCEQYQQAVTKLSKKVSDLASLMHQAEERSTEREEQLMNQLNDIQAILKQ